MKNLLLSCSMLLYCLVSIAQKTVLTYTPEIDNKADKKAGYESFVMSDANSGKTAVVLKKGQSIEYLLLNKDQAIEAKVIPSNGVAGTIFKGQRYEYYGGFIGKKGACFFYSVKDKDINKGESEMRMETVDFAKNTVSSKILETGNEIMIETFVIQQNYYMLKVNNGTKEIVIYKVDENGTITSKAMEADIKGFNREKLTLSEYFSYRRVFYPGQETELPAATDLTKIYPSQDKVTIVVTNQAELPHVWTIDLKTYTLTRKKFDLPGFAGDEGEGKKRKANNNSFVFNNNLYVLNNNKEKIEIGIFDLASGKLLKKQEITDADMANFVEQPMEIMDVGRKHRENKIESVKELVKELSKGTTGIAVARTSDGNLMLTCGIYDSEVRTGTMSNSTGSFGPTNITRNYNYQLRIIRSVSFKMILNLTDLSFGKSKSACSFDKINEYAKTLPANAQAGNWFDAGSKKYFSFYNPEKSVFAVQEVMAGK